MQRPSDIKYSQITIDSCNLYWRCVCSCAKKAKESIDDAFIYTNVITEFLSRVKDIQSTYGYDNSTIYFLFDNPKSKINVRKLIDDHYKSHRYNEHIPKEFWDTLALLEMILQCYSNNYVIMRLNGCEADDLVYPLIKEKVNDKNKMLLISVDMDWSRALSLSENVHWFNYSELFWHREIFKQKYSFYPEGNKVKFFKTFRGDTSDDISPAVPNIPSKLLLYIMDTYDDINVFISSFNKNENIPEQWKIKILENRSKILSNYQLVDFVQIEENIETYSFKCKENIPELRYWFKLLDLPFENRMIYKEEKSSSFFKKPKAKYYRS